AVQSHHKPPSKPEASSHSYPYPEARVPAKRLLLRSLPVSWPRSFGARANGGEGPRLAGFAPAVVMPDRPPSHRPLWRRRRTGESRLSSARSQVIVDASVDMAASSRVLDLPEQHSPNSGRRETLDRDRRTRACVADAGGFGQDRLPAKSRRQADRGAWHDGVWSVVPGQAAGPGNLASHRGRVLSPQHSWGPQSAGQIAQKFREIATSQAKSPNLGSCDSIRAWQTVLRGARGRSRVACGAACRARRTRHCLRPTLRRPTTRR
ncbi:hypothetical protein ABIB85_008473, partial [Bradyrhizobium sp. JR1.5]